MFLYRLTFASGKVYIGQTGRTVEHRYKTHAKDAKRGSALPVHKAWRKYGAPAVETLGSFKTIEELNAAEISAIAKAASQVPTGYNLSGGGNNKIVHSETRQKLSQRVIGDEWRASMSAAAKRRVRAPWSDETRAKMSESAKLSWKNPEHVARRVSAIEAALIRKYSNMRTQ